MTSTTSRFPAGKASPASTGTSRSPASEPRKQLPPSTLAAPSTSPKFKSQFNTLSSKDTEHHRSSSGSKKEISSSLTALPPPIMRQRNEGRTLPCSTSLQEILRSVSPLAKSRPPFLSPTTPLCLTKSTRNQARSMATDRTLSAQPHRTQSEIPIHPSCPLSLMSKPYF